MGTEGKYGKITTERGSIPADEPVFILRAQDKLAIATIEYYQRLCMTNLCPSPHVEDIGAAIMKFEDWRDSHQTRLPGTGRAAV